MGNGDIHPWTIGQEQVMHSIASSLRTIANCMEANEIRARERGTVDTGSLGALALWRWEVSESNTRLGFTDWLAWHESDKATTQEEIELAGEAIQAVKRGFAGLEAQVKGEGDAPER